MCKEDAIMVHLLNRVPTEVLEQGIPSKLEYYTQYLSTNAFNVDSAVCTKRRAWRRRCQSPLVSWGSCWDGRWWLWLEATG